MVAKAVVHLIFIYLFHTCYCFEIVAYSIDDTAGHGRRFDGIGAISGGGATSVLLQNYPEKQRNEVLDYLFKPNFGASLHLLKVEIGGDSQSTEGTEASHMHNSWDENYNRGYEWWLMKEAKKRNPDILLYALPWAWPGWIGNGTINPYHNIQITANYVLKWIQGAKKYHNLTIDLIGIWNERPYDVKYIKLLRNVLDENNLQHVRIVAADGGFGIVNDINKDPELAKAIDFIGVHYPGTESSMSAVKTGKQLWASEDYSTFNDNVGGGCWARLLNQNYVNGRFTGTIAWNLIASYYDQLPYARNGLMTANSPWSGNYVVNSPIWISAHTTQFTSPGWNYLQDGSGIGKLKNGGSYVSLVSPDGKDLTVVIETMSHDHSICVRPPLPAYKVVPQNITLKFGGSFAKITEMTLWYSQLGFDGKPDIFMKKISPVKVQDGILNLTLSVDEVVSLTTLTVGQKGTYGDPPPSKPFPVPYKEDFEGKLISDLQTPCPQGSFSGAYEEASHPNNFAQQAGVFEVIKSGDTQHGNVLRQVVLHSPIPSCPHNLLFPVNLIGNFDWTDISVSVDAKIGDINGTDGIFLAARVDKGGCQSFYANGVFFFIFPSQKIYHLAYDLAMTQVIFSGPISNLKEGWNNLELILEGYQLRASINGQLTVEHTIEKAPLSGFIAIGTSSYGIADFDNLSIFNTQQRDFPIYNRQKDKKSDSEILYFVPEH